MSNNFELLNELALAKDLFSTEGLPDAKAEVHTPTSPDGKRSAGHAEAVNFVQRLFLTKPETAPHAVVFTSAEKGAGCSWVCARSSEALADRAPGLVCVVDGNVRSPSLHARFRLRNRQGLSDALSAQNPISDYLQQSPQRRLSVLPAGTQVGASAPWDADRLAERIAELRRTFMFLLIDSPAINLYSDVAVLTSMVDGAILVIDAESTRRQAALQAKEVLAAANLHLLGAVLNKRKFPIPDFIYRRL
jgi:protein-tyrosine kinase